MALPVPRPGLVVNYAYLWHAEAARGRDEGKKNRPCAVILATQAQDDKKQIVTVAPITHTPQDPESAVPLPPQTQRRLGLDDAPQWIVTSEVNRFAWPGPDLRPVRGEQWAYGLIPDRLYRKVKAQMLQRARDRRLADVKRDDAPTR